jgi:phosphoglycerol transferase MdoB-like AlkP superfamily enzyme
MKRHIVLFFILSGFFLPVFLIQKVIFISVQGLLYRGSEGMGGMDVLRILYHGFSIDASINAYLTVIPFLFLIASVVVWKPVKPPVKVFDVYYGLMLFLIALATALDNALYFHWGFHPDTTVLLYLRNLRGATAGVSTGEWIIGIPAVMLLTLLFYAGYAVTIRERLLRLGAPPEIRAICPVWLFLAGILFLSVRGGLTVSTMNVGRAYFSNRMFLNHAAVNPIFNFIYSLGKYDDFAQQYQFYEKDEATRIFNRLHEPPPAPAPPPPGVLHGDGRPNILLFILESFSYEAAMDSTVAPNMSRFAAEGLLFKNFYANGFRTDRGLVSILSGYPSHPTAAILKYPKKTETLPSIPKSLRQAGYANRSLYYGGDINFANMRSYFIGACDVQDLLSDTDFPVKERLSKWGVPDGPLLDRLYRDLTQTRQTEPFLKIVLTLSSHEPFDVPTDKFDVPFLNSIYYADACLGKFISDLKTTSLWNNTLIILIADHAMQRYPPGSAVCDAVRFKIPMIWLGGAVKHPAVVSDYGSQNDLAATLLSQLRIDPVDYRFSKDMLNPQSRKFAFYSYVNGFCMMDSLNSYLYDNNRQCVLLQKGDPSMEKQAKAFFQTMYLDLGSR